MSLFSRCLIAFCLIFAIPLMAQPSGEADWLYKGSDIPRDPAWQTGTLPNGVHYAVRRNALPAGQVSMRVRVGVGSLNEADGERGWAHLIEHIAFRGTKSFDGQEAEHLLQQLGARPGGDTNASTGAAQTIYQLDLPKNDRESVSKGLHILSEMVDSARFEPAAVDGERKIVLAEKSRRSQLTERLSEVAQPHFYPGLKIAQRDPIGTEAALAAASPATLRAFYERWYRPDLTTVVVVGDADPAMLTELLISHFGGWQASGGARPASPDLGRFAETKDSATTLAYPGVSNEARLMWYRPYRELPKTLERDRINRTRSLATIIINRRLEARARENAPFLSAGLGVGQNRYSGDTTSLSLQVREGRWREALQDAFGILADALRAPPSAAEIERELSNMRSSGQVAVRQEGSRPSPLHAAILVGAVESGYPPMSPGAALENFETFAKGVTPAQVAEATKSILSGVGPRMLLLSPEAVEGGAPFVSAALAAASKSAPTTRPELRAVSIDSLPKLGPPGKEVSRQLIEDMGVTIVRFANGSSLTFKQTDFTFGEVAVQLRVGTGVATMSSPPPPGWMQSAASLSGLGDVNFSDLQRLYNGRRLSAPFLGISESGVMMSGVTTPEDLVDQLRLFALKLAFPRWDDGEFSRGKAAGLQGYDQQNYGSAAARGGREASALMHAGDPRWAPWPKEKQESMMAAEFARSFEPYLATGPLELVIVGDIGLDAAIAAAAQSIGALPARPVDVGPVRPVAPPRPDPKPQTFTHKGDPAQAYALIGWSTPGRGISLKEFQALAFARSILELRLTDRLRKDLGATYSVSVANGSSDTFSSWGVFSVAAQVKPENTDSVFRMAREEVADLARRPITAEEFARTQNPFIASLERAMKTNSYWSGGMLNWTTRPELIELYRGRVDRMKSITPEDVRAVVAAYIADEGDWSMLVLPEKVADKVAITSSAK